MPYPPSPRGYPLIGNVLDLATGAPIWESLASLADREGTLSSYSIFCGNSEAVFRKTRMSYTYGSWART